MVGREEIETRYFFLPAPSRLDCSFSRGSPLPVSTAFRRESFHSFGSLGSGSHSLPWTLGGIKVVKFLDIARHWIYYHTFLIPLALPTLLQIVYSLNLFN